MWVPGWGVLRGGKGGATEERDTQQVEHGAISRDAEIAEHVRLGNVGVQLGEERDRLAGREARRRSDGRGENGRAASGSLPLCLLSRQLRLRVG